MQSKKRAKHANTTTVAMSKNDKHWATWILDGVVAIGAIAQIVIGYILICQLTAYQQSNAILDKTLKASHIPFLNVKIVGVNEVDPAQNGGHSFQVLMEIENVSQTPASNFKCSWGFTNPANNTSYVPAKSDAAGVTDCILPGVKRNEVVWFSDTPDKAVFKQFTSGQLVCQGTSSFNDFYGNTYGMIFSCVDDKGLFPYVNIKLTGDFDKLR